MSKRLTIAGYDPWADCGPYVFKQEVADRYLDFIQKGLTHVKGGLARKPFLLQPWQIDFCSTLFGWVHPDTGFRRYRDCLLYLPRKNGKSTLASALALACLLCDGEGGCEAYLAASSKDQSGLIFEMASGMIEQNDDLSHLCKVTKYHKRIEYGSSYLRSIPADDATAHGFSVHVAIGDELHAWKRRDLYDVLRTGRGSRDQPLCVWITTAPSERDNICYDVYDYARRVRDGDLAGSDAARTFLPVIYEAPAALDWKDPETWKIANPGFGVSVSERYLQEACDEAKDNPSLENVFRRLHLNQITGQITRWISMHHWDECEQAPIDFLKASEVVGGLDWSVTTDFTSWCMYQPDSGIVRWRHWLPEENIERLEKSDMVPYTLWQEQGWIETCPGATIDFEYIEAQIEEDCEEWGITQVGLDLAYCGHTAQTLEGLGIKVVKVPQSYAVLNSPCMEVERLFLNHTLNLGGNPVARWMFDNVELERNTSGLIRPCRPKKVSKRKKIDGVASLVNAVQIAISELEGDVSDDFHDFDAMVI